MTMEGAPVLQRPPPMLPTEDQLVYVYVLVDDAIGSRAVAIPARPDPRNGATRTCPRVAVLGPDGLEC